MLTTDASGYFDDVVQVIANVPTTVVDHIVSVLLDAYESNRTIFLFGNGSGKRFQALALTDNVPLMTAWANDANYEDIFAEQLTGFVRPDDIVFAISCSGKSPNVLKALKVAREADALTIGLTGFDGGHMKDLCDVCLIVPSDNMQIIEDLHLSVTHAVFTALRAKICQESSEAAA